MKENSKSLKEQKVSEINNIEMIKKHPRMLSKITDEMKNDIISGMKQKDFIKKYYK